MKWIGMVLLTLLTTAAVGQGPILRASAHSSAAVGTVGSEDLFRKTAAEVLAREFPSGDLSYLLLDLKSRTFIVKRWQESDKEIPVGSLVKPFTAISYAQAHGFRFPEFTCTPGACWYPHGHGKLDIVHATALSCNAYFINLATDVDASQVWTLARSYGLNGPGMSASPDVLAGRYGVWQESPEALAKAYGELLSRRDQPGIREIVKGMAMSAREGTAVGIANQKPRVSALAKTGTAPCTHVNHEPGDGFVAMAWPAESPQYLLLLRYHGKPGAHAAIVAGKMLKALQP